MSHLKHQLSPRPFEASKLNTPPHQVSSSLRQPDNSQSDEEICSQFQFVKATPPESSSAYRLQSNELLDFGSAVAKADDELSLLDDDTIFNALMAINLLPIYKAWENKDLGTLKRRIKNAIEPHNSAKEDAPRSLGETPSRSRTRMAWGQTFRGEAHILLHRTVESMLSSNGRAPHGNWCPIIQGSGTGKSRLVDKLAESIFTIPIVLRNAEDESGYPLADEDVLEFLRMKPQESTHDVVQRYLCFLVDILKEARTWVIDQKKKYPMTTAETLAWDWRIFLEKDDRNNRKNLFFKASSRQLYEVDFDEEIKEAAQVVDDIVSSLGKDKTGKKPFILFYFDEAHNITNGTGTNEPDSTKSRSSYQCLCNSFTYFKGTRLFVLFLSTFSQLSKFSPSAREFWSFRGDDFPQNDDLNPPFVELPFDVWEDDIIAEENKHTVHQICSLEFMARFGRPLFWTRMKNELDDLVMTLAIKKLTLRTEPMDKLDIDKLLDHQLLLPCLALRIDLTFESNRDNAIILENLLVASSMRTVFSVPKHRQYLRGGYPSEPFLAEAAARKLFEGLISLRGMPRILESYKTDIPIAISKWFQAGLINKGQRGELIARILLTLAHDLYIVSNLLQNIDIKPRNVLFSVKIPVTEFLHHLISPRYIDVILNAKPQNMDSDVTLKEAFKDAFVHFTQFIKADDNTAVTDEACMWAFIRGAIIQGHDNLEEIDTVLPVCMKDELINRWSMTAIFLQIKNCLQKKFTNIDAEGPKIQFFSTNEKDPSASKRPYITIAMELGVQTSSGHKGTTSSKGKKADPRKLSPSDVQVKESKHKQPPRSSKHANRTHPRYEIKLFGCSPTVYNVIADHNDYNILLAHKGILSEHPRQEPDNLQAVMRMKPVWRKGSASYSWARAIDPSRVGAVYSDGEVNMMVDEKLELEHVKIGRFDDPGSDSE